MHTPAHAMRLHPLVYLPAFLSAPQHRPLAAAVNDARQARCLATYILWHPHAPYIHIQPTNTTCEHACAMTIADRANDNAMLTKDATGPPRV